MGDRAPDRARRQTCWARLAVAVACLAVCLGVSIAAAGPATGLDLDACNNTDAPIPASPYGDGSWIVRSGDAPTDADPFDDPGTTLESTYGTTPKLWTYDNGCTGQFVAGAGTAVANVLFQISGALPNWSHALLATVVDPKSPVRALDNPVVDTTHAVTEGVWKPWLSVALLLVAAVALTRARSGEIARTTSAAAWAGLVLLVTTLLISYPAESVRLVDDGVRNAVGLIATGFDHERDAGEDPAVAAIDAQMDQVIRTTQYRTWAAAALGDPDSATAGTYGPDLFRATHFTFDEYDTYRQDPNGKGKRILEAKQDAFKKIAEEVQRSDPRAYDYLKGEHWSQRLTAAFINLLAVIASCGYLLGAGLAILLAFVLIRLLVPFAPAAGMLFMFDSTRDMAVGWLHRAVGPLVMGPIYFLIALVLLRFFSAILTSSEVPYLLKLALIAVLTVGAWRLTRPSAYGIGHLQRAAGFAWGFATGWRRKVTPFREAPQPQPTSATSRTSPAPPVAVTRPIAESPARRPALPSPTTPPAVATTSTGLDDAVRESIDKAPNDEKESWKRLYADFPRGSGHSYLEKARWAAAAYQREDLLPHQRNRLRGQWTNYAFAHHYRAVEVSIHHLDAQGRPQTLTRADGIDDTGVASIKNLQFTDVKPETWKGYIREVRRKYQTGRDDVVVAATDGTRAKVDRGELRRRDVGRPLRGAMYLDVPPQNEPIPQDVFDYAREKDVIIRIREPHPDAGELDG